jgi:hypothetical protein
VIRKETNSPSCPGLKKKKKLDENPAKKKFLLTSNPTFFKAQSTGKPYKQPCTPSD